MGGLPAFALARRLAGEFGRGRLRSRAVPWPARAPAACACRRGHCPASRVRRPVLRRRAARGSKLHRPRCRPHGVARSGGRLRSVCESGLGGVGELSAGAAQGGHGKRQRIEPLIIPQLGEVKANRGRLPVLAGLDAVDEPGQAAVDGGERGESGDRGSGIGVGVGGQAARRASTARAVSSTEDDCRFGIWG